MRKFLLKMKHFFKRNIYPVTVSVCTILILAIITVSAYSSIKESGNEVVMQTVQESKEEPVFNGDVEELNSVDEQEKQNVEPISSSDPIIFSLPFESAEISKNYADTSLLYDNTTKMWCTHQGIDFACEEGKKVVAIYDGKIEKIENTMMYGTIVYLKISDYKGRSSNINLKEGDTVKKGAVIGTVTSFLAEKADGVHLHLELTKDGKLINPTEYFLFNK